MKIPLTSLFVAQYGAIALASAASGKPSFDWDSIEPSKDLQYHDCYEGYKCARLQVPLDWKNESDPRTVALAITKLPAVVPDDDPTFGGSIFTNPGGPGGSGVGWVQIIGRNLQFVADKPGRRHYEIVSWDPRGIANTTPRLDCYPSNTMARDADILSLTANGALDRSPASLSFALAILKNMGSRCRDAEEQVGEIMPFVNTPSVARDMVEMVDKIDNLRKHEAAAKHGEDHLELRKRQNENGEDDVPRLQYIGFSYGTILGNYFASLFPGRVGRVVLDGVCNTDDYANGPGWLTNTVDTDEIFDNFLAGCVAAGPLVCKLAKKDETFKQLRARVWKWIDGLDESPEALRIPTSDNSIIVSGASILEVIGSVLYSPIPGFVPLAALLDQGIRGNYTALATILNTQLPVLSDACPVPGHNSSNVVNVREPQSGVLCGDGDDITGKDLSWWHKYAKKQLKQSAVFGAFWTSIRLRCSSWPSRPNWSFKGPFTTPKPDPAGSKGKPAAPLLFLSNRLDPVTPLSAARAMAANHPGAAVLVQESMGHCAVVSAPSDCTRRILADYFDTGAVPSKETSCETSCGPWDEGCRVFDTALNANEATTSKSPITLRKFPLGLI